MNNTEKPYTLKRAKAELKRLEKSRTQKKETIKKLTEEMKAENVKIKELEAIYDKLYHEELQRKIADAWFKKGGMTGEQIEKFIQLSGQIKEQINLLDVETAVRAIHTACEKQEQNRKITDHVDTSSNFSGSVSAVMPVPVQEIKSKVM